ncbi:MAG: pentapeptide repeat-containing protein [bacterium]|nr:pentapeptide repeat-containing protein [bacterium]
MISFDDDTQIDYVNQNFEGLEFSNSEVVEKEFEDCTFVKCDFNETSFKECKFYDCTFTNCNLSLLKVKECSFSNTLFEDSKVVGVDWTEVSWPRVKLSCPIKFSGCNISYSSFIGLNIKEISIKECIAREVDFMEADLSKAKLTGSDFAGSAFNKTNLTGADLTGAVNYNINAILNRVKKAKFSFPEAISLLHCLGIELVGLGGIDE